MELYIDTADLEAAEKIVRYYPIDGITTNPKILAKSSRPEAVLFPELKDFVEGYGIKIFVQVTAETAEEMAKQAAECQRFFGERLVVKLPAVLEGYRAVDLCKRQGITVCVTVIHSVLQAFVAAKAGADYVAPYISHMDNLGCDGVQAVKEMEDIFCSGGYPCKVLGASFRTADQIRRLAVAGCDAVTVAPELFGTMIAHPATEESMDGFRSAWAGRFGALQLENLLKNPGPGF